MADIADLSDDKIEYIVAKGRANVEAAIKRSLKPIIVALEDGSKEGVCHWCQSVIHAGHLYCERDPHDVGRSCSEMLEYEQKRRKELGL